MQATDFPTLRDLVLHFGAQRGWLTQRQIAVMCGLDESALSRFLNGEQDLGARRTHALFRDLGVPIDLYDLAYALLAQAQEQAKQLRVPRPPRAGVAIEVRGAFEGTAGRARRNMVMQAAGRTVAAGRASRTPQPWPVNHPSPDDPTDVPAAVVAAFFAEQGYSGARIAEFFGE